MLSSIGCAAIRRSGVRATLQATGSSTIKVVPRTFTNISRTNFLKQSATQFIRTFATAKVPLKAKAAKTTTAKPTKKAPAKKAPVKKAVKKPVKKAVKKPVKKAAKKPVKKKAKAIKKPAVKRKILTPEKKKEQKIKIENKTLKALLVYPPKQKPTSAWLVLMREALSKGEGARATSYSTAASARYKSLSTTELEAYERQAEQNRLENKKIFASWLETLTPDQVKASNHALARLTRRNLAKGGRRIADPRKPKLPISRYALWTKKRWASGDFKGEPLPDAQKVIVKEFRSLSEAQKKVLDDECEADRKRYEAEVATVYNN